MLNYEVTFIVDPVLSGDEIKSTAQTYLDMLQQQGVTVTSTDEMGLRQLAYPINKKYSGVYYSVEFQAETGEAIPKMELALRRDERIMRFLTVRLDKFAVKYNQDKRDGKIGKVKKVEKKAPAKSSRDNKSRPPRRDTPRKEAPVAKKEAPAKTPPPVSTPASSEEE